MPEGHSLHRLARDQQELVGSALAASSPQGRFRDGAEQLDGLAPVSVEAYGKHLVSRVGGLVLHVHLGLRGKFLRFAPPGGPPLRQVRLRLATPAVAWDLIAPSACELLDDDGLAALLGRLGPDPLRPDADPEVAWANLHRAPGAVGSALLDQAVLSGVGNVFRAEVLLACGIHPRRPAASLDRDEFDRLWATLRAMMTQAVEDNRIITVDPPDPATARTDLDDADARRVYKQERCRNCGTTVETFELAGRTAYACPACQAA
jgi:formamidopyrimidine-DNA glycosylase